MQYLGKRPMAGCLAPDEGHDARGRSRNWNSRLISILLFLMKKENDGNVTTNP
jgi:hypothetical protein